MRRSAEYLLAFSLEGLHVSCVTKAYTYVLHIACSGRLVIDRESKCLSCMGTDLKVTCYVLHIACGGHHAILKASGL